MTATQEALSRKDSNNSIFLFFPLWTLCLFRNCILLSLLNVRNLCSFPLYKTLKKINLVSKATYDFTQKKNSNTNLLLQVRWHLCMKVQVYATWWLAIPLDRPLHLITIQLGRLASNIMTKIINNNYMYSINLRVSNWYFYSLQRNWS